MNIKRLYIGAAALALLCVSSSSFALTITCGASVTPVQPRPSILGTSPEEIHRNFPAIIEHNMRTADTTVLLGRLSDREIADLAAVYTRANAGSAAPLLKILAQRADGATLQRLTMAFGDTAVSKAVQRYAPSEVQGDFLLRSNEPTAHSLESKNQPSQGPTPDATPTVDMTPTELYLEFRTAPIGSLSPMGALFEAGTFAATRLSGAFGVGYTLGSGMAYLTETYAPDVWDSIGGTIDQSIHNILDATDHLMQGDFERAFDDVMGGLISDSGDYDGDYDVSEAYGDFMDSSCD